MKRRDVMKKLQAAGFVATEGGNHTKLKHPDGRFTYLGRHKEIPNTIVRAIEKQTKVKLLPR